LDNYNTIFTGHLNKFLLILLILVVGTIESIAQIDLESDIEKKDSLGNKADSVYEVAELHSVYFNLTNIFDTIPTHDTIMTHSFPYFNELDTFSYPMLENGYIGSSSRPLLGYEYENGFKSGLNQYKAYALNTNSFHVSNAAFTDLKYINGADIKEFSTGAKFYRNFKDLSLDIDYSRINNEGKYQGQKNKHTELNIGFWKGNLSNRSNLFINIRAGVHEEEINGGIVNKSDLYYSRNIFRENVAVKLNGALARKDDYSLEVNEYYRLNKLKTYFGFRPYVKGQIELSKGFYKFYDKSVSLNADIYKSYLTDDIGIRNYFNYNSASFKLSVFAIKHKVNYIEFGGKHKYIDYTMEPLSSNIVNQFNLFTDAKFQLYNDLVLKFNFQEYLGSYKNEYSGKANISYTKSFFKICTALNSGKYSPSLYDSQLYITNKLVYNNQAKLIGKTGVDVGLEIKKIGFSVLYSYNSIENYIYFNEEMLPNYADEKLNYQYLNIREDIKLWIFNLDNNLFLMQSSSDIMPLPKYILKSKFYVTPHIAKNKVFLNTGFEFNLWDKYNNYGFNPVLGNYYVQNEVKLENYIRLDYYLSAKVSDFQFFIRINNVLDPLSGRVKYVPYGVRFKVLDYPQSDLFYRLGIKWTFID